MGTGFFVVRATITTPSIRRRSVGRQRARVFPGIAALVLRRAVLDAAEELMKVDGSEAPRGVLMRKYATRGEYATPAQNGFRALRARLCACMASSVCSTGADEEV